MKNSNINNKRILVIGAAGLLGKAVTEALIEAGYQIVACDIDESLLAAYKKVQSIETAELDVTDESAVKAFFSNVGALDGAVNCSYPRNKTYGAKFFDVSLSSFNENLNLHLGSAFLFAQQCAKYFQLHDTEFSLVNIASIYGVVAPDFSIYDGTEMTMPVEYAAIKSALIHLNKYIANYINDSKFRINSVSPGGLFAGQDENFLAAYQAKTHGKGMLSEHDIVSAVLFLVSSQSRFVNGQNIVVDDGFSL